MYKIYDAHGNLDLSILADYCTFLGLLITIITFLYAFFIERRVKRLIRRILFDNSIGKARNDLRTVNSNISSSLSNYTQNIRQIKNEVRLCETILQNVKKQIEKEDKKAFTEVLKLIDKIDRNKFDIEPPVQLGLLETIKSWVISKETINQDHIWDLYSRNNAIQKRLEYIEKKFKIIGRYV